MRITDPKGLHAAMQKMRRDALIRLLRGSMRDARLLAGRDCGGPTLSLGCLVQELLQDQAGADKGDNEYDPDEFDD